MNPYLINVVCFTPDILGKTIAAIPESSHRTPTAEGRFSPLEVICHLADWEPIMRGRIQTAVSNPGTQIEAFDEAEMAIAHRYSEKDIHAELDLFAQERSKTRDYLATIAPDAWDRTVTHPERGVVSAGDLANMLLGHDLYHIEQLTKLM